VIEKSGDGYKDQEPQQERPEEGSAGERVSGRMRLPLHDLLQFRAALSQSRQHGTPHAKYERSSGGSPLRFLKMHPTPRDTLVPLDERRRSFL
jgi:hypothetical protein